ncbi:MAG: transporter substrate-binding domain-containing protein [Lachnospiraceae bacterium]|nr:transporter substrate-binding domain-containing protein [Lachnospiraceae bacterium]
MNRKRFTAMAVTVSAALGCFHMNVCAADTMLEDILETGVLQVATEPYFAPYEFIDSTQEGQEQYQGADMQLARYIADELGVELEIVAMDFSDVLENVAIGEYPLAITGLAWTVERAETYELSDVYYSTDSVNGFLIRAEDADVYTDLDSLAGKTVACQSGTVQETYASEQIEDVNVAAYDSVITAVRALLSGSCDAVAVNDSNGATLAELDENLIMAEAVFEDTTDDTVVACPKGQTELVEKINEILAQVAEKELYEQWWEEAQELSASLNLD